MAKKSTAIDVTQGVIWQQLLSLCVPIFFSSFFQQAYTLIGTYIVGQFGGKLALGGIQATMVLTELCIGFCVGVGAGCFGHRPFSLSRRFGRRTRFSRVDSTTMDAKIFKK